MNVNDPNLRKAADQFAENLEKYPMEEQIAISVISKNIINGCSWEFVRNNQNVRQYVEQFKKNPYCDIKEVTYSHDKKISGYLVLMNLQRLVDILTKEALGVFDRETLQAAVQHRHDAITDCAKLMKKGYRGKIGIFCTNDSPTITVDGISYPAFAVTLNELCDICAKMNYGMVVGSSIRTPDLVKAHGDDVIKSCIVAPSSNALFMNIAPLR